MRTPTGIWRRLSARVLFFQALTRNGGRKAPHFRDSLTAVLLAAVHSVADGLVGDITRAIHGPDENFQLPVQVLETLCLLVTRHCGVWLPCGNYWDYEVELRSEPGLVVVGATGHRLAP